MNKKRRWLFVVDTDSFSGNFEREMCAYLTGMWDNDTHGGKQSAIAKKELPSAMIAYFENHVSYHHEEVDDGSHDVCQIIYPTPGWWNNGMGKHTQGKPPKGKTVYPAYQSVAIFFNEKPPDSVLKFLVDRAKEYCKNRLDICDRRAPIKFISVRLIENDQIDKVIWTA
jgi:hypothetical protein